MPKNLLLFDFKEEYVLSFDYEGVVSFNFGVGNWFDCFVVSK